MPELLDPVHDHQVTDRVPSSGPGSPAPTSHDDRLSTIPEGDERASDLLEIDETMWATLVADHGEVDESWWASEPTTTAHWSIDEPQYLPDRPPAETCLFATPTIDEHFQYHALDVEVPKSTTEAADTDDHGSYVEILVPGDMAKLFFDSEPPKGMCGRVRFYLAGPKKNVIERDTDLLTAEEFRTHKAEVASAVKEEFMTWIEHKVFGRLARSKASRNILDCRWVGKWKWTKNKQGQKVRVIRMRLTLRGFKDNQAEDLETYAATSSRLSQRIVVSEAAVRGWRMSAMDVKKAFLKGITYEDLAKRTGETLRRVEFELSPDAVAILRTCKGYENFDPRTEVLTMLRPGTGCKDAPRCWSIILLSLIHI